MDRKDLDELLYKIFSNVNLWLNFAEAKNAANIAFVIAFTAAIFSLHNMNVILYTASILLIVSGIGSLISFLPRLGNKVSKNRYIFFKNKKKKETADNLIFFETIKEYSGDTYIEQLSKKYFDENKYNPTKYQIDLSDEIVYNSDIVSRKYKFFKISVLYFFENYEIPAECIRTLPKILC